MSSSRFPTSMRAMRAKFPTGPIVQVRVLTEKGSVIEMEGATTGDRLTQIIDLVTGGFKEIGDAKKSGAKHGG